MSTCKSGTWCFPAFATACAFVAASAQSVVAAQNPSLLFSTPITGSQPVRMAVDQQGFIYLAGPAASSPAAFVMKLTPSRSVVYTTFLRGSRFTGEPGDCTIQINAIAVDNRGSAYVTGCTTALDFPLVNPLRSTPGGASRGSGFVAKVGPTGTLVYSSYLREYNDTAIAVDDNGSAYIAGPGVAAKLSPSGSSLVYSKPLPVTPNAIAVDRAGAAYLAGTGKLGGAAVRPIHPCHDNIGDEAFVIKLNPAGSSYDYATCLGGSGDDAATGIAVDAGGAAYVVGTTYSVDFPTVHPLDVPPRTGPLWKTEDGGETWTSLLIDGYSVQPLVINSGSGSWFVGSLFGGFMSDDRGATWRRLGLPLRDSKFEPSVIRLAADPRTGRTLYASTSEGLFKSTDSGEHWSASGGGLPGAGAYLRAVAVDPGDSRIVYAAAQQGFWKSVDGGATWTSSTTGLGTAPYVNSLAVDPVTRALYADVFRPGTGIGAISSDRLFISTDAGATWSATALDVPQRSVTVLTAVRSMPRPPAARTRAVRRDQDGTDEEGQMADQEGPGSTVYLAARQVFSGGPFGLLLRSDDGGQTWETIGEGLPARGVDALAVSPRNPAVVYAASSGPVFVSRDRGDSFAPLPGVSFDSVSSLAVDPASAGTVLVGTSSRPDAFVAKIAPGGGSLEYSTYLGGAATDRGAGVIVDDLGRAIVFGATESDDFPDVAAIQPRGGGRDAFVAVVDGGGSVLLFSSWIGGTGSDAVVSVAASGRDVLISGGSSDLATMFPASGAAGPGAFVGALSLPAGLSFRGFVR